MASLLDTRRYLTNFDSARAAHVLTDTLVIGYGNDLRTDDGAGRWVAERIESFDLPGVSVRSVPQLTPELTLDIAGTRLVECTIVTGQPGERLAQGQVPGRENILSAETEHQVELGTPATEST